MTKFVCLLLVSFARASLACEGALVDPLALARAIPRLDLLELALDADLLSAGDDALTPARPARVLTQNRRDRVLAVDVAAVLAAGPERLAAWAPDDVRGQAWRTEVWARLSAYAATAASAPDWRTWWRSAAALATVDDIFFLRFFGPGARFALVSLNPPATHALVPVELPPPVALVDRRYVPPDDVWFALKPKRDRPRYVIWDVPGQTGYVRTDRVAKKWFVEHLDGTAEYLRGRHGVAEVFLPTYSVSRVAKGLETIAHVYAAHFEELPGHQIVRVTREVRTSLPEILALGEASARRALAPAVTLPPTAEREFSIAIPEYVVRSAIDGLTTADHVASGLRRLFERQPEAVARIRALRADERVVIVSENGERAYAATNRVAHGRTFVFSRMSDGQIYVTGWLNTNRLD